MARFDAERLCLSPCRPPEMRAGSPDGGVGRGARGGSCRTLCMGETDADRGMERAKGAGMTLQTRSMKRTLLTLAMALAILIPAAASAARGRTTGTVKTARAAILHHLRSLGFVKPGRHL